MCQTGKSGGSFPIAGEAIDDFGSFLDELTPIRVTYQARLGQDKTKYVNFLSLPVFPSNINYIF